LIRSGQARASDVVEAHLDRIASVNPKVNAVTLALADTAKEQAGRVDAYCAKRVQLLNLGQACVLRLNSNC
jgi:Asp-tRNA(Asn)/Glu-tRNA(Gln) amidotransferase A subunit family amidase